LDNKSVLSNATPPALIFKSTKAFANANLRRVARVVVRRNEGRRFAGDLSNATQSSIRQALFRFCTFSLLSDPAHYKTDFCSKQYVWDKRIVIVNILKTNSILKEL
jgi:hypothetical protein